jgi:hypothetical protein
MLSLGEPLVDFSYSSRDSLAPWQEVIHYLWRNHGTLGRVERYFLTLVFAGLFGEFDPPSPALSTGTMRLCTVHPVFIHREIKISHSITSLLPAEMKRAHLEAQKSRENLFALVAVLA